MLAEYTLYSFELRYVAKRCRCAVYVNIVYIRRLHSCIFEGIDHYHFSTISIGVWSCKMVSVGTEASADNFGVYLRTASFGVFVFFEYQTAGAFSKYETVARFRIRTRSGLRAIVACR